MSKLDDMLQDLPDAQHMPQMMCIHMLLAGLQKRT